MGASRFWLLSSPNEAIHAPKGGSLTQSRHNNTQDYVFTKGERRLHCSVKYLKLRPGLTPDFEQTTLSDNTPATCRYYICIVELSPPTLPSLTNRYTILDGSSLVSTLRSYTNLLINANHDTDIH